MRDDTIDNAGRKTARERGTPAQGPSRRAFLRGTSAAAGGLAARFATGEARAQSEARTVSPNDPLKVSFRLNGEAVARSVDTRRTVLDLLREDEGLTGTKVGCNHGQCGACTVHLDGRPRLACLTLAAQIEGKEVTTIEGLDLVARGEGIATPDGLHPVQEAFVEHDAFQCGYCTPGQIMSAVATIQEGHATSADQVREYMSGNLCRCAAYPNITAAILDAREAMGVETAGGGAREEYHLGLVETAGADSAPATEG